VEEARAVEPASKVRPDQAYRFVMPMMPMRMLLASSSTALLVVGLAGCNRRTEAQRVPPPPVVTVVRAEKRNVPIVVSAIGTTRALNEVAIRARVAGFLKEGPPSLFQEGRNVQAGQLLFVIDEEPFQAAVASAEAVLEQAQAELKQAEESQAVAIAKARLQVSEAALALAQVQEARSRRLLERVSITRDEYDESKANLDQARADVATKKADVEQARVDYNSNIALAKAKVDKAKADLTNAQLELSYCRMISPINGRIGEARIKLGNYVTGLNDNNTLALVEQLDPMGVDFRPSSRHLPMITRLVEGGLTVRLFVQGDRPFPHEGRLIFLDNVVDPTTSTFLLRASVPNPEETLLPGDYVKVNTEIGEYQGAIVVPEKAVVQGQAGASVFVVDDKDTVVPTVVKPVDVYQGLRVLEAGLEPGQRVIVEGLQLIRPGLKVQAEEVPLDQAVPKVEPAPLPSRSERLQSPLAVPRASNGEPPPSGAAEKAAPPQPESSTTPTAEPARTP
jgi:membrane fusion protein (multidrug efflux system)